MMDPLMVGRNLTRNKRRSVLVMLGVTVAVFVMASLQSAVDGILFPVQQASNDRILNVREKGRANVLASRLPASLEGSLEAVKGVAAVTGVFTDLALVGPQRVHIFVYGVDADPYRTLKGFKVDEGQWKAFKDDTQGMVAGHILAQQMGWTVGSLVEIKELSMSFHVSGILPDQGIDLERHIIVHRKYLQQARGSEGRLTAYLVRPAADAVDADVQRAIDEKTSVTQAPTETASEGAYAQKIVEQFVGFVDYLKVMGLLTLVITLLGALNAVSMSVRERVREIGVLRTLGFKPSDIIVQVMMESTLLAVTGGLLGLALAKGALGGQGALLAGLQLQPHTLVFGFVGSVAIVVVGGLIPAWSAVRMSIVDTLRVVD